MAPSRAPAVTADVRNSVATSVLMSKEMSNVSLGGNGSGFKVGIMVLPFQDNEPCNLKEVKLSHQNEMKTKVCQGNNEYLSYLTLIPS